MLCEGCNESDATIHLTQVVDGVVKKVHLCETCAAQNGLDVSGPMALTDILKGMGGSFGEELEELEKELAPDGPEISCPACHLRRSDFKKSGRLGCPECYETFETELIPLIKGMHRSEKHIGKVPAQEMGRIQQQVRVAELEEKLGFAVDSENYEEAAKLRDALRDLLGELGVGSKES